MSKTARFKLHDTYYESKKHNVLKAKNAADKIKRKRSGLETTINRFVEDMRKQPVSSNYPSDANMISETTSSKKVVQVKGIRKLYTKGRFTIVECFNSNWNAKIFHERDGQCSASFNIGAFPCSYLMNRARSRCNKH